MENVCLLIVQLSFFSVGISAVAFSVVVSVVAFSAASVASSVVVIVISYMISFF